MVKMSNNQRSVIAKSISNQVIDVQPETLTFPTVSLDANAQHSHHSSPEYTAEYPTVEGHVTSSKRITYLCPSITSSPNSNIISPVGDPYDPIYARYELIQMKRKPIPVPYENKDEAYWERRRRNNESAKRSREIRRIREMQTTKRIAHLEQENVKLEAEVKFLREEIKRLRETEFFPYLLRNNMK